MLSRARRGACEIVAGAALWRCRCEIVAGAALWRCRCRSRGRRSILCIWVCVCVAGVAFGSCLEGQDVVARAAGGVRNRGRRSTLAVCEIVAGAALWRYRCEIVAGAALWRCRCRSRGRRSILCIWVCVCVAGVAFGSCLEGQDDVARAAGGVRNRGRRSTLAMPLRNCGRRSTLAMPLPKSWQAQHSVHLGVCLCGRGRIRQLSRETGCCRARGGGCAKSWQAQHFGDAVAKSWQAQRFGDAVAEVVAGAAFCASGCSVIASIQGAHGTCVWTFGKNIACGVIRSFNWLFSRSGSPYSTPTSESSTFGWGSSKKTAQRAARSEPRGLNPESTPPGRKTSRQESLDSELIEEVPPGQSLEVTEARGTSGAFRDAIGNEWPAPQAGFLGNPWFQETRVQAIHVGTVSFFGATEFHVARSQQLVGEKPRPKMGMGQNSATRPQVLVHISIYQGKPFWVPGSDPNQRQNAITLTVGSENSAVPATWLPRTLSWQAGQGRRVKVKTVAGAGAVEAFFRLLDDCLEESRVCPLAFPP